MQSSFLPSSRPIEVFTLLNGDIQPRRQEIEVASSFQIPHFQIIGLPGPEVSEAKDRIRSAIESCEFGFPQRKIVLNLSPASVRKQGTGLDLPMAIAVLLEGLRIENKLLSSPYRKIFAWGELGLDGRIKPARSPIRALEAARLGQADLVVIAREDQEIFRKTWRELFSDFPVPPIAGLAHLREIWDCLDSKLLATPSASTRSAIETSEEISSPDASVSHLLPIPEATARILQIAAAGGHHFLLLGPKGVGKSLSLEWFLALQPELDRETRRVRGFLAEISGRADASPNRRVSTQAKPASLLGSYAGGALRPGEFSLAHGGVLLADEFPEWSRDAREALREPLERRMVSLTRVNGSAELPADFVFAGNGNLCPCGGVPDAPTDARLAPCRCHPVDRLQYLARLSGPILDRLDLVAFLYAGPVANPNTVSFAKLREDTERARRKLRAAFGKLPGKLAPSELEAILGDNPELRDRLDSLEFRSFRDRHKTLRLALTLAALRDQSPADPEIVREARSLRLQAETIGVGNGSVFRTT